MPHEDQEVIYVVSGLPRSGTSLAMQMLTAGGIEPMTDGQRVADESNPRGYLELEAVKGLKKDTSWVAEARGRVVKVISHLVADLPRGERYLVLFVERDLEEVLASQEKMLERLGRPAAPRDAVRRAFTAHLQAFERLASERSDLEVLRVAYAGLVDSPEEGARRIAEFFDRGQTEPLDRTAMAATIDPALYRNRGG